MRVSVLVPYSTSSPNTAASAASSTSSSRQHSPGPTNHSQRRGSLVLFATSFSKVARSPSTAGLTRRRTVFGDPGWAMRGLGMGICPDGLVDALDCVADSVTVQTTLAPLPLARPLVILVPIMSVAMPPSPAGPSDSTPSAICFPIDQQQQQQRLAISPLDRALAHLRRAKRELDELAEDLSQIVLLAYSANNTLSGNVSAATVEQGAKGILTPPFTPEAVLESFASALQVNPEDLKAPSGGGRKESECSTSTYNSLAQYVLPGTVNNAPTTTVSTPPPPTLRIPSLRPLKTPSPITSGISHPQVRSLSAGYTAPPPPFSSSNYHHQKPLPPLPPPPIVLPVTPITADKPSFPSPISPTTDNNNITIAVNVHTKIDGSSSSLEPLPEPTVSATPYEMAVPTYVTASPDVTQQRPSPLHAVLPLAHQPYGYAPHPGQKSLPPLSPPVESTTTITFPTKPPMPTSISMDAAATKMTTTVSSPKRYADPVYEYIAGNRRRSVDTGGLALAMKASDDAGGDGIFGLGGRGLDLAFAWGTGAGAGWGWGGWEDELGEGPLYAELLSDMYVHTRDTTDMAFMPLSLGSSSSIPPTSRRNLIQRLSRWDFEPHHLSSDELIECASLVFEALFRVQGMREETGVEYDLFPPFLAAVRSIYHEQNKYHNFQHAVDVLQAVYSFLVQAECVPPITILLEDDKVVPEPGLTLPLPGSSSTPRKRPTSSTSSSSTWSRVNRRAGLVQQVLENRDLLALCIAAIGHDVGHPGLSNAFMKNARTPLSVVYDDKSALEQMHCALLLQLMRKHGLGHLILTNTEAGGNGDFRHLLVQTVLITDMSLHFDWMGKFGQLAKDVKADDVTARSRDEMKVLICQALIKCGDISNPTRPHVVSEHWSSALLEEWACQAMLERELGLPISVVAAADEIVQAKGQVGFIDLFTKPLFDATASVVLSFDVFAHQGDMNRSRWQQRLNDSVAAAAAKAVPRVITPRHTDRPEMQDLHFRSVFPLSLPQSLLSPLPTPSPRTIPIGSGWPSTQSDPGSDDESNTPTMPTSAPREARALSSVSSTSSAVASPSPFSPGATGDAPSTAASSPSSHSRSMTGESGIPAVVEPQTTPMRAAYQNASVRRKKSFHRASWDISRNVRGAKVDPPPPIPALPPSDRL